MVGRRRDEDRRQGWSPPTIREQGPTKVADEQIIARRQGNGTTATATVTVNDDLPIEAAVHEMSTVSAKAPPRPATTEETQRAVLQAALCIAIAAPIRIRSRSRLRVRAAPPEDKQSRTLLVGLARGCDEQGKHVTDEYPTSSTMTGLEARKPLVGWRLFPSSRATSSRCVHYDSPHLPALLLLYLYAL